MERLIVNGLVSWISDLRWYNNTIYLLSVVGPTNSTNSVWSHYLNNNLCLDYHNTALRGLPPYGASTERKVDYLTLKGNLDKGNQQLVLVHPSFSPTQVEPDFYGVLDSPDNFWPRFIRWCPIPVKPEWKDIIWDMGIKLGYITPLSGFGREAWRVNASAKYWLDYIADGIKSGGLR